MQIQFTLHVTFIYYIKRAKSVYNTRETRNGTLVHY